MTQSQFLRFWKRILLPFVDYFSLIVGGVVTYFVRYRWLDESFGGVKIISGRTYFLYIAIAAAAIVGVYIFFGLYHIRHQYTKARTLVLLGFGIMIVLLGVITYFFFNEYNNVSLPVGVPISRFILGTGGFFAFYTVLLGRLTVWGLIQIINLAGFGKSNIIIVGERLSIVDALVKRIDIGKFYTYKNIDKDNFEQIIDHIISRRVSEVYLLDYNNHSYDEEIVFASERNNISLIQTPHSLGSDRLLLWQPIQIGNDLMVEVKHSNLDGWWIVAKRTVDVVLSAAFVVCFSWLYLLIYVMIKLDSQGPALYPSGRVSPRGDVFKLWKFRRFKQEFCTFEGDPKSQEALEYEQQLIQNQNMKPDSVLYKIKDDPRTTRVGRFIEKYSFDELPQMFNVLKGDLSLVGPRPHQPREVKQYQRHHYKVLNIQPGVTGLAQVNGRSDLSFEEEVLIDTYYIERWNIFLDVWILLKTPYVMFFGRHKV